ncbi:DUF4158 domain-containing protein [Frankia sp. AiPs1]|uniref:DUF4158 domain-containing protein n=1 Tax=Frankia sp. AiPs1 TaxID=573493 RepID=UPI002042F737|nr:DUF4158 domain-containing protein [Frankia sp. AiPs1]MCM3920120.1 DUF4158 domain-containing protein [Frankia sp. AiPs1]
MASIERTSTGQHRLALLVLLKCYQRLGYFPNLTTVPGDVVGFVCSQLGLAESVAAEHDAPRTVTCCRAAARANIALCSR